MPLKQVSEVIVDSVVGNNVLYLVHLHENRAILVVIEGEVFCYCGVRQYV